MSIMTPFCIGRPYCFVEFYLLFFFSPQSHFWAYRILAKMFHSGRKFPGDKTVSGNGHKRKIGAGKERNGSPQQKKENLSIK